MMSSDPAFPHRYVDRDGVDRFEHGMSLRDYFAAMAMDYALYAQFISTDRNYDDVAKFAYQIADAMVAERKRTMAT